MNTDTSKQNDLLDPAADRDLLLQHISSLRPEDIREFVSARLASLEGSTKPKLIALYANTRVHEGFIHPKSDIKRVSFYNPFRIDDPEIYEILIKNLQDLQKSPGWNHYSLAQLFPYAMQHTIGQYFGNSYGTPHTEERNVSFYDEHYDAHFDDEHPIVSMKEMKDKGISVCAERSPTAQNLLSFCGYNARLIITSKCKFPRQQGPNGHAYNIIQSPRGYFIFDPNNPSITTDADGKVLYCNPSSYPLTAEEFKELINGGSIKVTHKDFKLDANGQTTEDPMEIVYGGP